MLQLEGSGDAAAMSPTNALAVFGKNDHSFFPQPFSQEKKNSGCFSLLLDKSPGITYALSPGRPTDK